MNSTLFINTFRFFACLAIQLLVFDNFTFLGRFMLPFPYILFIILYPVGGNKIVLIWTSFLLGFLVDLFHGSGGVHASACLILAFFRQDFFKISFGRSYEYQTIKLNETLSAERFLFMLQAVVIHHFVLFLLEAFDLAIILEILLRTTLSSILTLIICITIIYIIKPSKK